MCICDKKLEEKYELGSVFKVFDEFVPDKLVTSSVPCIRDMTCLLTSYLYYML